MTTQFVLILTILNLFNYVDRFLMSASLSQVKADFLLSDFQGGMLFSSFVIPYIVFSLLLAYYADRTNRLQILKIGTLIWSASAVLTAFAQTYTHLIICRSLLGVGEAAFAAVAPAVVHHMCVPEKRGKLMALFTSGLPLGMALGFVGGGYVTDHHGWRASYLVLGIPALIVSVIFAIASTSKDTIPSQKVRLKDELKSLVTNRAYMLLVLGYAAYMFVGGGVTHWMPTYIEKFHNVSLSMANAIFGGAAIGFGLLGTWFGGIFGDRLVKTRKNAYLEISYTSMALAFVPYVMTCFASSTTELIVWISITQFLFFISNSPLTIATFQAVSVSQASFAMAVQIFVCHLLGDALSAPLIGKISDMTGNLKIGILMSAPVIILGAVLWYWPTHKKMARVENLVTGE